MGCVIWYLELLVEKVRHWHSGVVMHGSKYLSTSHSVGNMACFWALATLERRR